MITEREETLRIQGTSVRGESEIWILDGFFYKKMTDNELDAYNSLSRYKTRLKEEANIVMPTFYGGASASELFLLKDVYDEADRSVSQGLYKISNLPAIKYKDIEEKFGFGLDYCPIDFDNIFSSLGNFRRITQNLSLNTPEDYESSTLELLKKSKEVVDTYIRVTDNYPLIPIEKSQRFLDGVDQEIAHRDLNWSNIGILKSSDGKKWNLQIADWGSFGRAYPGYDEGRLFTRLSLNEKLQHVYLELLVHHINKNTNYEDSKKFMVSFWRTVAIRSHREIFLTISGRYENPANYKFNEIDKSGNLKIKFYKNFINSHQNLIKMAVDNLEFLLQ